MVMGRRGALIDPWQMTGDARRSKRARIKKKIEAGTATAAEQAWLAASYRRPPDTEGSGWYAQLESGRPRAEPGESSGDTAGQSQPADPPLYNVMDGDTAGAYSGASNLGGGHVGPDWTPPADLGSDSGNTTGDTSTGPTDTGSAQSTTESPRQSNQPDTDSAVAFGAAVAGYFQFASRLAFQQHGIPPNSSIDFGIGPMPIEHMLGATTKFVAESATRVARKYNLSMVALPYQDEIVTAAAIAAPTILLVKTWRASKADKKKPEPKKKPAEHRDSDDSDSTPADDSTNPIVDVPDMGPFGS